MEGDCAVHGLFSVVIFRSNSHQKHCISSPTRSRTSEMQTTKPFLKERELLMLISKVRVTSDYDVG